MKFKSKRLSNGLNIIGEINEDAKSAAVGFFVKTGSRDETMDINGVSHFLEHMLFKGTDKLSAFEVNEAFDRTGAQFNAFTNEEMTVFYAAVLPEYLAEITELWAHLMRPSLRDDDFDMEKNVIKEEIAMYQDLPNFEVMDQCRSLHFEGHPCGHSVLGTPASIDNLTSTQMRNYFNNRYAPNNMLLSVVGNFDWDSIAELAEKLCGQWQQQPVKREVTPFAGTFKKNRAQKANLVSEHICMMSAGVSFQDERRFAAYILASVIGDVYGSRYFWELIDNAVAQNAVMQYGAMDGTGALYSYFQCGKENVDKVLNIVNSIFKDITDSGITEDELTKARNKILSSLVIKNELPMGRLVDLGFNWVYNNQYITIKDEIDAVKKVTIADIKALIADIKPSLYTQFSVGPQ